MKAQFPNNPFRDEEECQLNLRCFQQYVMTGNLPSRSDDLYPLPHRAYKGQPRRDGYNRKNVLEKVESNANSASKGKKSGCRHRHHHHHHHKKRQHDLAKAVEMDASICMSHTISAFLQFLEAECTDLTIYDSAICNPQSFVWLNFVSYSEYHIQYLYCAIIFTHFFFWVSVFSFSIHVPKFVFFF